MKVCELAKLLEELDGNMDVSIAYQPSWPLATEASHLKVRSGSAYICQSSYGGNAYAPQGLFDDNENELEELENI